MLTVIHIGVQWSKNNIEVCHAHPLRWLPMLQQSHEIGDLEVVGGSAVLGMGNIGFLLNGRRVITGDSCADATG